MKYLKDEKGLVRAVTTDNLQLEKPLTNENYDVNVFNRNMDKVDASIQEVKGQVDGLELTAQRVSIADPTNAFEATNVEDALLENKTSILNNTTLANQALTKANEAFQRGDNVKTQLVDKLISEGLNVSTNNTFEELISGIALGKKWASGIATRSSSNYTFKYYNTTATFPTTYIDIPLSFEPSYIFVNYYYADNRGNISLYFTVTYSKFKLQTINNVEYCVIHSSHRTGSSNTSNNTYMIAPVVLNGGVYRMPLINGSSGDISWIAIE